MTTTPPAGAAVPPEAVTAAERALTSQPGACILSRQALVAILEAAAPHLAAADRELLGQAQDVMHSLALRLLGVSPRLKEPYTDMPDQSPWSMTIGPMASRAYDTAMTIRQHLGLPHRWATRALGTPPLEIEDVIAEAVAAELERIRQRAQERLDLLGPEDYSAGAQTLADILLIVEDQP